MIPLQEPQREFQSEPIESLRPEGREGNRQRRTRELIFGLLWQHFLLVHDVPCSFISSYFIEQINYIKIQDLN